MRERKAELRHGGPPFPTNLTHTPLLAPAPATAGSPMTTPFRGAQVSTFHPQPGARRRSRPPGSNQASAPTSSLAHPQPPAGFQAALEKCYGSANLRRVGIDSGSGGGDGSRCGACGRREPGEVCLWGSHPRTDCASSPNGCGALPRFDCGGLHAGVGLRSATLGPARADVSRLRRRLVAPRLCRLGRAAVGVASDGGRQQYPRIRHQFVFRPGPGAGRGRRKAINSRSTPDRRCVPTG